ncbi:MAG TPA: host attachment protein [Burkholderiaceae bacterium]|jgi:protein required for attachment to host cells|nr:host attachment protein [Burkholderiaceae bacterium]
MGLSVKRNWLVVANAARARVLEENERAGTYTHVVDLVHPQSRQKGVELAKAHGGDRAGLVMGSGRGGAGGTALDPRTDPHDREHDRFARELATALNEGVASGRCAGLVLVASDPFLGRLKSHLDTQAAKALLRSIASDYTLLRDDELAERIGSAGRAP